jgi:hypothetical protein
VEWFRVFGSGANAHGGHAIADGTIFFRCRRWSGTAAVRVAIFVTPKSRWTARRRTENKDMRQGIAARAVMLHLRACYVSKAAILTIPVLPGPVENRSPA